MARSPCAREGGGYEDVVFDLRKSLWHSAHPITHNYRGRTFIGLGFLRDFAWIPTTRKPDDSPQNFLSIFL